MPSRRVATGAATLSVTDRGAGTPIVLLHAFPLTSRMWAPQLAELPQGWRGLAPDLRGFGASSGNAAPARHVRDHALDVLGLIDALECGPVVLVGLSMGGYVAFECWRQRSSAVRGLVLADTRADADTEEARTRRLALQQGAAAEGTGAVIDAMLPGLLGATTQAQDPHVAVQVRHVAMENETRGIIDALEALRTRPDSRPDLATITCPVLVIVGAEDTITPPAVARTMADAVPDGRYVELPAAGHLSNVEQPHAFTAALHEWLGRLS